MTVFLSLRTKIFLLFVAVAAAVLAAALLVVNRYDTRQAVDRIEEDLRAAHGVFERVLGQRRLQLATNARLLGTDYAFRAAVGTRAPKTVLSAALNHRERLGADRFVVTDDRGRVLADTARPGGAGADLSADPLVAAALDGAPSDGIWEDDGRLLQMGAVPVLAPDPIGVLAVGFLADDAMARELKRLTRAEISFLAGRRVTASTLAPPAREAFERDLGPDGPAGGDGGPALVRRRVGGERFIEAWGRLGAGEHRFVLQRSLDRELAPLKRLQEVLLLVGLGALLLAGAASLLFAHDVTRPLRELVRGTQLVTEGRYDHRLKVRQQDEVGVLADSFNEMMRGLQEREKIRSTMNKVVSREIAEELLKGEVRLGGEIRFATVLFSDIRGFTGISESIEPQQLVAMLNEYLTLMSRIVEKHHGVIDKYIGDAIMALFGAPIAHAEDVDNSLRAALDMLWALEDFNYRRAWEGKPPVRIGLGVNTGPVVAGNMGSEDRLNYTVLGDSVNLASRLEGLTRIYGVNCLVSEFTQRESKGTYIFRELDLVRVKGRNTPVRIFELWDREQNREVLTDVLQKFQNARQFYLLRDWRRAETLFQQVLESRPDDGPSRLYLSRIDLLKKVPPPESWDGVFTAVTK
jgi:adenylate cyclase